MLFQVVCSVLLSVLAFHTPSADWLDLSTANQHFSNNRFLLVTQRAKQSTSSEGAAKSGLENDVRLLMLFCFTHFLCVTSSALSLFVPMFGKLYGPESRKQKLPR